jgi:protein-tyrosine phosphatase
MKQIYDRVWVGNETDCKAAKDMSIVHACKTPCHQKAVGYTGSLPWSNPHYLAMERKHSLYLNLIDPPLPLFKPESFKIFLDFAKREHAEGRDLLIHCNQGQSRAPSLAMLLLAKGLDAIDASSLKDAREDFQKIYPSYNPGKGIEWFLSEHWDEL